METLHSILSLGDWMNNFDWVVAYSPQLLVGYVTLVLGSVAGFGLWKLVRSPKRSNGVYWDIKRGR